jgi:hypothetical protein
VLQLIGKEKQGRRSGEGDQNDRREAKGKKKQ